MKQFGRRWNLSISNNQETLDIDKLRIAFEIDKTINEKPNPAKIQIWNLNRTHINQLLSMYYKKVILSVGYGELHQIFSGDITKARIKREGMDFIMTLECAEGYQEYTQARSTITLGAGATDKQIVLEIKKTMPNLLLGAVDVPNPRNLPRGCVLNGSSRDILNRMCLNNQANWFIQDGEFVFLPRNKVIDNDYFLISMATGMINSPEQTDDGLEVTCLLNPALQIGRLIKLESIIDYFNGEYKIVKLVHTGDGIGGDWHSKITVVGGKFEPIRNVKKKEKEEQKNELRSDSSLTGNGNRPSDLSK